jgi:hypothetical protein
MSRTLSEIPKSLQSRTLSQAFARTQTKVPEQFLYGTITKFYAQSGIGVICAEDGRSYRFESADIINARDDLIGQEVHFTLHALRPRKIIVLAGSPWSVFSAAPLH